MRRSACCAVLCVTLLACGEPAARGRLVSSVEKGEYARALALYERDGRQRALLRAFAETLLLDASRSDDAAVRREAFQEWSQLGTRALPWLERLSEASEPERVRAAALQTRLELGDGAARSALRKLLDSADPEVIDRAYAALDPDKDRALLVGALRAPRLARREQALRLLARVDPPDPSLLPALIEVARFDPEPPLRAAAVRALARYGAPAADTEDIALHDASESVRAAALEVLPQLQPTAAEVLLSQQLGSTDSASSVAAAATLLRMQPPREPERAEAAIIRALQSGDGALRAQAASTLRTLPPSAAVLASVRARLASEPLPEVTLLLCLALPPDDKDARATLERLMRGGGMAAVQASAELARRSAAEKDAASVRLTALRTHTSALVRRAVAHALASATHHAEAIVPLLADASADVRSAAAGAVLSVL